MAPNGPPPLNSSSATPPLQHQPHQGMPPLAHHLAHPQHQPQMHTLPPHQYALPPIAPLAHVPDPGAGRGGGANGGGLPEIQSWLNEPPPPQGGGEGGRYPGPGQAQGSPRLLQMQQRQGGSEEGSRSRSRSPPR